MDIHGEDSFGLTRENGLLFRHNHHMYFNDFSVPSSKALKELEDIDAMAKHVIMKGLNEEEEDPGSPPHSMDTRSPSRHVPGASPDFNEPSLKLEEDDELGSTLAFFRKPSLPIPSSSSHPSSNHLSHSMDDLLPQHHTPSTRHDYGFIPSFDLRGGPGKAKDVQNSSSFSHANHHEPSKNENSLVPSLTPLPPTIINNINTIHNINHISHISTINNISNINTINSYNTINTINNSININININSPPTSKPAHHSHPHDDIPDPTTMDDKSAVHLINNANNLEFLDDYITTGSNSSSSPDESPLNQEEEELDSGGLNDSTASLANAFHSAAMVPHTPHPLHAPSTPTMTSSSMPTSLHPLHTPPHPSHNGLGIHRISSAPVPSTHHHTPPHTPPHPSHNRLHHSTGSLLASSAPSASMPISSIDNTGYHSLNSSCSLVIDPTNPLDMENPGIPIVLGPGGTTIIDGVTYNNRGYEVCGSLNKFNKPCQRIGRCPFHHDASPKKGPPPTPEPSLNGTSPSPSSTPVSIMNPSGVSNHSLSSPSPAPTERRYLPIKKGPYKSGWKKDEHIRFLKGLQMHGKGSWKEIALIVGTRTPTQIQVHAHRYYLRQQQETKNKRSIHDISLQDLEELEVQHGLVMQNSLDSGSSPHLSPPSPDRSHSTDLSHMFTSHHSPSSASLSTSSHHLPLSSSSSSSSSPSSHHHSSHSSSSNHLSSSLTNSPPPLHTHSSSLSHSPLSHSDGMTNPAHMMTSSAMSSPPISAPSSPLVPPISSSNFPPLFSGSATASSLSNTLPGLPFPTFPLAPSYNYHSSSWFSAPPSSTSSSSSSSYPMSQMSNLNSMTINMSGLGDVDLHLPPPDQKMLSPLSASFSNMSDDEYEDELSGTHHTNSAHPAHHAHHSHSHPSSPEEEFPSDDD